MHRSRYIVAALLAVLVAVACPAAVSAQSAGDDQYEDPLAGGGSSNNGGGGSGGGGSDSGGSGGGGGADAPTQQASTEPGDPGVTGDSTDETAGDQAQAAGDGDDDGGGLPRTGFPIAMLLIAGAAMVVSGFQLRRNTEA